MILYGILKTNGTTFKPVVNMPCHMRHALQGLQQDNACLMSSVGIPFNWHFLQHVIYEIHTGTLCFSCRLLQLNPIHSKRMLQLTVQCLSACMLQSYSQM